MDSLYYVPGMILRSGLKDHITPASQTEIIKQTFYADNKIYTYYVIYQTKSAYTRAVQTMHYGKQRFSPIVYKLLLLRDTLMGQMTH